MRTKTETDSEEAEKRIRDIRRATRRQYSAERTAATIVTVNPAIAAARHRRLCNARPLQREWFAPFRFYGLATPARPAGGRARSLFVSPEHPRGPI